MYANSESIEILTTPHTARDYLLLIRAGSRLRPPLKVDQQRNFDVGLNYYDLAHPDDTLRSHADLIFTGGLSKFPAAKKFFDATQLHNTYKGVWFLDDDLAMLFNPTMFFSFCTGYQLDLAQPSLTADSNDAIKITQHHPGCKLRYTNFVEIMAPYLARDFLQAMLHSFDFSISGWGLDCYWGYNLRDQWRAAVIDDFQMRHTVPRDFNNGAFYKYLRSININPYAELRDILDNKMGVNPYIAKPLDFIYYTNEFRA